MKKTLIFLIGMVLSTTAFGQSGKYHIKGTVEGRSFDGKLAVLQKQMPDGEILQDSCVVRKGKFSFKGTVEEPIFAGVMIDDHKPNSPYLVEFVLEPGTIHIDHLHEYDRDVILSGTPQNNAINEFRMFDNIDTLALNPQERRQWDTVVRIWNGTIELSPERSKLLQNWGSQLSDNQIRHRLWQMYHQNEHNLVAIYVMRRLIDYNYLTADALDSILRTADPKVSKEFANDAKKLRANENTSEGEHYIDIPGTMAFYRKEQFKWKEKEGSLKDIIDGKLALVEFWASWSSPLFPELRANLVQLYNKYKDSGFVVVGVNVRDDIDYFWRAISKDRIKYPQLIDSDNVSWNKYGLKALPEIILIGPDGTILARNLRNENIEEAVIQALKNVE